VSGDTTHGSAGGQYASHWLKVLDVDTHYIEAGKGPLLLLVHGGGAGADCVGNWGSIIPHLSEEFHVVAVDMVGFGRSVGVVADVALYTQAGRVRWLAAFVEALGQGPAVLVGNSMGGATTLGVAIQRPELVAQLVLMGSAGLKVSRPPSEELRAVMDYDFTYEGMERVVRALTGKDYQVTPEIVRYRQDLVMRPENREGLSNVQKHTRSTGGMIFADEDVARISAPTLALWGKEDKVVPVEDCYRFLELIGPSWGFIVPGCGHWPMIEKPEAFISAFSAFRRAVAEQRARHES
jgi:2-hydroxy-6-oxo-6-(2'-aminophenyl)hexa-2,4-dienoate hydrolase